MSFWTWDESLSVGVDIIDGQHRRIVDYINDLHAAHKGQNRDKVSQVLMGLVDYTITHFSFEEELMSKAGYPLSDSHKKVHASFIAHLNTYIEQHEKGRDVTRKLLSELQLWLTNHIKNEDKHYAPLVRKSMNPGWVKRTLGRFFG